MMKIITGKKGFIRIELLLVSPSLAFSHESSMYRFQPRVQRVVTYAASQTTILAFVLSENLERSDNSSLKADTDEIVGSAGSCIFNGTGTVCNQAASGGTEQCYDITK